ncbi:hypothetical protein CN411_34365, partial [Bacillus thuringiensis]
SGSVPDSSNTYLNGKIHFKFFYEKQKFSPASLILKARKLHNLFFAGSEHETLSYFLSKGGKHK